MEEHKAIEDLEFIKKVINDSKRAVIENGVGYIVWGFLIIIGLVVTHFHAMGYRTSLYPAVWPIVVGIGLLYTIFEIIYSRKRSGISSFAGKMIGTVWYTATISMLIIGVSAMYFSYLNEYFIGPLIMLILGMAFIASATLMQITWLKIVSHLWWAGGFYLLAFPTNYVLLIMSVMMFCLQVVPGIYLYIKYKREKSANNV